MVKLSSNRIAWTYTDGKGVAYRVAAQKALTDQGVLGGQAAAPTVPPKPSWIKMRRMTMSGAGYSRVLPVYSTDATVMTGGTSINVNAADDVRAMTSSGDIIPEVRPVNSRITKQAS